MNDIDSRENLDIATLPLSDGRKLAVPLLALAEVQQLRPSIEGFGSLNWRGHELPVTSLEAFCGLEAPAVESHTTVGIFRAAKDSSEPFRALAFCGLAAHHNLKPGEMNPVERPEVGQFSAAAEMDGETYLIPDLPELLFKLSQEPLH